MNVGSLPCPAMSCVRAHYRDKHFWIMRSILICQLSLPKTKLFIGSYMYLYIFRKKCALPSDFMMKVTPSYQVSHSFPGSLLHWKSGEVYQSNNEINFLKKYIYIFLSCLCVFKSPQNGIVISLASIKKI